MVASQKASTLPSVYGEVLQPIVPEFQEKAVKKPRAPKSKLYYIVILTCRCTVSAICTEGIMHVAVCEEVPVVTNILFLKCVNL